MISIALEHPVQDDLALLHARHTEAMHAETPPESIHMLPADALAAPGIRFYVMRKNGEAVAMGALKEITADHAEIKSMHLLAEHRGEGLAQQMLQHLVMEAEGAGYRRLSLETGAENIFAPARALYERAGFQYCGPFEGYKEDPNSVFMTLQIA
ncbi:GNAT family N-acetyltransferase [Falsigemmobacter intermedius]|uniref:GNAT family N-acetyltransferase n=1 Tax=Falsigemmobacter intermedius TaxID=1553448 RepID=A0A3S3UGM5_9RHOB|nr:GNAT family N-acetyltransferase [Falsigemmobacter intermedius]RWY43275.1 GNAT family N-acetyltransferase [Falsigemmobacter intermedius]